MSFDIAVFRPDNTTETALADPDVNELPDGELLSELLRGTAGVAFSGPQKLIQTVVIDLWSKPQPDGTGAGLQDVFDGSARGVVDRDSLRAAISQRVSLARNHVIRFQSEPGPVLDPSEVLTNLSIIGIDFIADSAVINLRLETAAGDAAEFTQALRFL